jgi:hypothetical protein
MTKPICRDGWTAGAVAEACVAAVVTLGPLDWPHATIPKPNMAEDIKGKNFTNDSSARMVDRVPPS